MVAAVVLAVPWATTARADLGSDVEHLAAVWRLLGDVSRLEPLLLERDQTRPLMLPSTVTDPATSGCTTVALLGAPSTGFVLRFLPSAHHRRWWAGEGPEPSVAGAAQLVRCGRRKAMLRRLAVEMRSPRGILEAVVVEAPRPVPSLRKALTHRDPGPYRPVARRGRPPRAGPRTERRARVRSRRRRQGAAEIRDRRLGSRRNGSGGALFRLDVGCHRIDVLGPDPGPGRPGLDVDAELRWADDDELVSSDRTESADASVSACTARRRIARLLFSGATPGGTVETIDARWDLPGGIPKRWDAAARGRIARAVWSHHARPLGGSPVYESMGVTGTTVLPMEVEPGACYVAALAGLTGRLIGMSLAVRAGSGWAHNRATVESASTAVGFCSGAPDSARLQVDARGTALAWVLGVWQSGRLPLGEDAQ